jgi:hypothetical protein
VPPREALQQVAADAASGEMLATITKAREEGQASASDPSATLLAAINLAATVQARVAMIT